MNTRQKRMTIIFNEWARQYSENPEGFRDILGEDGKAVSDYGEGATRTFDRIADELDAKGALPKA